MSIVADLMNKAATDIMNALTHQGFFAQDHRIDAEGEAHKVGNAYVMVNGVKVEVTYTKPEIKLTIGKKIRTAFIVRPIVYDDFNIRSITSTVYAAATKFAKDVKGQVS